MYHHPDLLIDTFSFFRYFEYKTWNSESFPFRVSVSNQTLIPLLSSLASRAAEAHMELKERIEVHYEYRDKTPVNTSLI